MPHPASNWVWLILQNLGFTLLVSDTAKVNTACLDKPDSVRLHEVKHQAWWCLCMYPTAHVTGLAFLATLCGV